jgi:hypothetical protein
LGVWRHFGRIFRELVWSHRSCSLQRHRDEEEDLEYRPLPASFTTIPPPSRGRRDYDDIGRQQQIEDEAYRRRLQREKLEASQQVL